MKTYKRKCTCPHCGKSHPVDTTPIITAAKNYLWRPTKSDREQALRFIEHALGYDTLKKENRKLNEKLTQFMELYVQLFKSLTETTIAAAKSKLEKQASADNIPLEPCPTCKGQGQIDTRGNMPLNFSAQLPIYEKCMTCAGTGYKLPRPTHFKLQATPVYPPDTKIKSSPKSKKKSPPPLENNPRNVNKLTTQIV